MGEDPALVDLVGARDILGNQDHRSRPMDLLADLESALELVEEIRNWDFVVRVRQLLSLGSLEGLLFTSGDFDRALSLELVDGFADRFAKVLLPLFGLSSLVHPELSGVRDAHHVAHAERAVGRGAEVRLHGGLANDLRISAPSVLRFASMRGERVLDLFFRPSSLARSLDRDGPLLARRERDGRDEVTHLISLGLPAGSIADEHPEVERVRAKTSKL